MSLRHRGAFSSHPPLHSLHSPFTVKVCPWLVHPSFTVKEPQCGRLVQFISYEHLDFLLTGYDQKVFSVSPKLPWLRSRARKLLLTAVLSSSSLLLSLKVSTFVAGPTFAHVIELNYNPMGRGCSLVNEPKSI